MNRRRIFLWGLTLGLSALGLGIWRDARRLRRDLALVALRRVRALKERPIYEVLARYDRAVEEDDELTQETASAEFLLRVRLARVSMDGRTKRILDRIARLGPDAADFIFQRLHGPRDPAWLTLFDAVGAGLAHRRPEIYRQRFDAFVREAAQGPWPVRVRVAIHRHRDNASPEDERQALGIPRHDAIPHLIDLLTSRDLFDRLAAAGALENVLNRPLEVSRMAGTGAWRREAARWRAFWRANAHRSRLDLLAETLGDRAPRRRAHACQLLAELGERRAEGHLMRALSDPEHLVQARAAGALARLGWPAAVRALLDMAYENDRLGSGMPLPELEEIEALGPRAAPALSRQLRSRRARRKPAYRKALTLLLKDTHVREAQAIFRAMATDRRPEQREIALDALADLGDASDVALACFVTNLSHNSPLVRLSAARGLARHGSLDTSVPVLIELLAHRDDVVSLAALALLQEVGGGGPRIDADTLQADRAAAGRRWRRWWAQNSRKVQGLRP